MSSLKLAFVGGFLEAKGGLERFVLEVGRRLIDQGVDVRIFCHKYDHLRTFSELERIPLQSMRARSQLFNRFATFYSVDNMKRLVAKATNWGADLLFLQKGYIFSKFLQQLTKKPIISYVHNQEYFYENKSGFRSIYRRLFGLSPANIVGIDDVPTICNSYYTANLVKDRFPNARNVTVVYPGVDHNKFRPTWQDRGYIYYQSRYGGSKNQKFAAEIASKIEYPLILSGFLDSKQYKKYFDELSSNKSDNVTILINISDDQALSYLQNCSVFLFPSINEPFGIATVEAMACGKPVVGHNSGATPEIISHIGYLCGDDLSEWVERVKYLMADRRLRQELGAKSHQTAKKYGWDRTVVELEKIFYSAIR